MAKIKVIHDVAGRTLTVWFGDAIGEPIREETVDGIILMKNAWGRLIGLKVPHYHDEGASGGISVQTIVSSR